MVKYFKVVFVYPDGHIEEIDDQFDVWTKDANKNRFDNRLSWRDDAARGQPTDRFISANTHGR